MYNTIIVPTDFSNEKLTIQALQRARKLSENGKIVLLHALEQVPYDVSQTRETLAEWLAKSKVEADIEVRHKGSSYHNVIVSAKENHADLILIDSHKPGLQDYLLGSTACKVVRHAPCSVLVVR